MSIFKTLGNMFSTKMEVEENFGWHNISTQEEVTDVLAASNEKPQIIYKHSPTCAISYLALKNLEGIELLIQEVIVGPESNIKVLGTVSSKGNRVDTWIGIKYRQYPHGFAKPKACSADAAGSSKKFPYEKL